MSKSTYLANAILDHQLGGGDYTRPATVYVSIHTGSPGTNGANECASVNNYSRAAVTNNATNWPAASGGAKSNGTTIQFASPSGSWGTGSHFGIWDAASGGNFLRGGALASSVAIGLNNDVEFAPGDLDVSES